MEAKDIAIGDCISIGRGKYVAGTVDDTGETYDMHKCLYCAFLHKERNCNRVLCDAKDRLDKKYVIFQRL